MHDAVEERDGPQPRTEPRIQHVVVLPQVSELQVGTALAAGKLQRLLRRFGHHIAAFGQIPGRNAVSPPKLPRNTPVLDVLHPMAIRIAELGRHEAYHVTHDSIECWNCQFVHFQKPLHGKFRLYRNMRTFRKTDVVGIGLRLFEQTGRIEVLLYPFTQRETVHTFVQAHLAVHRTVRIEDIDDLQIVFLAYHIVVHIVGRGHLQHTRSELRIHIIVRDDGNAPDAKGHIAEYRLRTRRSHRQIAAALLQHVAQIVELPVRLAKNHLLVRKSRLRGGVPVHHTYPAVNQSFVIEIHEDADDAARTHLVHRECGTLPIARGAQPAELFEDNPPVLLLPLPGMAQELLARERRFLNTLLPEPGHHLGFGSYRGVVGSRHPAGVHPVHPGTADKHVLQGIVQHVPHVEHACHIRGWYDYCIGRSAVGFRMKVPARKPVVVPLAFELLGNVFVCYLHSV